MDTFKLALLSVLIREAKLAMADWIILKKTNAELYKANVREKKEKTVQVNSIMHREQDTLGWKKLNKDESMPKASKKSLKTKF